MPPAGEFEGCSPQTYKRYRGRDRIGVPLRTKKQLAKLTFATASSHAAKLLPIENEMVSKYQIVLLILLLVGVLAACTNPLPTPAPTGSAASPSPTLSSISSPRLEGPELGKILSSKFGCLACHTSDGNLSVGPTWRALYGKEETITGGARVLVDAAYLRESIIDPNAKVVEGYFSGIMLQDFGTKLSEPDTESIIQYIRTLR